MPDGGIQNIFLTNAISQVRVADALAHFVDPDGTIAFMYSDMGSVSTNDDGRVKLYRASKAALNSLIRSFRARHGKDDLTVLALHFRMGAHPWATRTRRSMSTPACAARRM